MEATVRLERKINAALRWPPVEGGLPAVTVKELLDTQRELLIRLRHACGENDLLWNARYALLIERMANWFHLLPASRDHHHFGAGGLLAHALESAVAAVGVFDRLVVGQDQPTATRDRYRTGMRWAAVCGSMLHDCAKVLTDLEVTGERTGEIWNPVAGSLVAWARAVNENVYRIRWRSNRAGQHRIGAAVMLPRIAGNDSLAWLVEMSGQQTLIDLMEAIMDGEQSGILPSVLSEADRISVADDLARRTDLNQDHRIPVSAAEHHILDAAAALLREGVWSPGGKVCASAPDGSVLLAWPRAGQDIADWLTRNRIPGVMRTPDAIADVLIDTGAAQRSETDPRGYLHRFRTHDGLEIKGLRLSAGNPLLPLLGSNPPAGDWTGGGAPSAVTQVSPQTPEGKGDAAQGGAVAAAGATDGGRPMPDGAAQPDGRQPESEWWSAVVARCEIAVSLAEDLASGKSPIRFLHLDGGVRYLQYQEAFKGYGLPPIEAVKKLIASGVADGDGGRIAQDLYGAPFKKGVKLSKPDALLDPNRAADLLRQWFALQADDGVREVGGKRYVTVENLRKWASLFGEPQAVIDRLAGEDVLLLGSMGGIEYARLKLPEEKSGATGGEE